MTTAGITLIKEYLDVQVIFTDRHTTNEGTIKLYVTATCKITLNGNAAVFGDLKVNDLVTYDGEPNALDNVTPTVIEAAR